jgi:hypothetical protein
MFGRGIGLRFPLVALQKIVREVPHTVYPYQQIRWNTSTKHFHLTADVVVNTTSFKKKLHETNTKSKLDEEKELFSLKRSLSAQYNQGNYESGLRIAVELSDKALILYGGKENAVYASCVNNIALMVSEKTMYIS